MNEEHIRARLERAERLLFESLSIVDETPEALTAAKIDDALQSLRRAIASRENRPSDGDIPEQQP